MHGAPPMDTGVPIGIPWGGQGDPPPPVLLHPPAAEVLQGIPPPCIPVEVFAIPPGEVGRVGQGVPDGVPCGEHGRPPITPWLKPPVGRLWLVVDDAPVP